MHSRVAHCYADCPTVYAVTGYSCGYLCYACRVEFPVLYSQTRLMKIPLTLSCVDLPTVHSVKPLWNSNGLLYILNPWRK